MENFLKGHQEREEARANRGKEVSEVASQRQQFDNQMNQMQQSVETFTAQGKVSEAQEQLNALRRLIQDTAASSIALTAHDMARCNATLSRLQQQVEGTNTKPAGTRKFAFSSKAKTKTVEEVSAASPTDGSTASASPAITEASPVEAVPGVRYGPCDGGVVSVSAPAKAVFISNCVRSTILSPPIAGSAFIAGCSHCKIYVACHQLRMKDCHHVEVYVWSASTPIIEHCEEVHFGPYRCWNGLMDSTVEGRSYSSICEWVRVVGEVENAAQREDISYTVVDDFQWLKKAASPHWRTLQEGEYSCCPDAIHV